RLLPDDVRLGLGAPGELQLLEQAAYVRFDRVFAEVQLGRDLPICLAFGDPRQDFALLLRESVAAMAGRRRGASHPVQHRVADCRIEQRATRGSRLDGSNQTFGVARLAAVAAGTSQYPRDHLFLLR